MLKNTCIDYTFEDGETVQMTIAFYAIYQLKTKNKKIYDEYNKIMAAGVKEEIEMCTVLYAAYLCANLTNEKPLSFEEFLIKCGSDRTAVTSAYLKLVSLSPTIPAANTFKKEENQATEICT